jgi:hypothetical protein
MRTFLTTTGVIFTWGTVLWRLTLHRDGLAERYLSVTMFSLAMGLTLDQPTVAGALDHVADLTPNLAHLLKHICILVAAAASRETVRLHRYGTVIATRGWPGRIAAAAGAVAILAVLFTLSPAARSAETASLTASTATDGYMIGYWLIYVSFLSLILITTVLTTRYFARRTDPSSVRTTFDLISLGAIVGMAYLGHKVAFIALRAVGLRDGWFIDHYDGISSLLIAGGLLSLVLGISWQALARLPVIRQASAYRALRTLYPLWHRLYTATPEVALILPRSGRDDRPGPRDVVHCLQRRVVEIRDGSLALHPYRPAYSAATVQAVATAHGVRKRDLTPISEAALLEVARRTKLAGGVPREHSAGTWPVGGSGDLAGEIRALSHVARRMHLIDSMASTLEATQKAVAK